jgi:hypothetical protein
VAFCDPSGGATGGAADSFTIAIAHKAEDSVVLDCIRERKGSPEVITAEYGALLHAYKIGRVTGDDYGAQWVKEAFARHGIVYESTKLSRVEIYLNFLPLIHSRRVELLDGCQKMVNQLLALERTTSATGRDLVKHPNGAHDDLANVVAGVLVLASAHTAPVTWRAPPAGISRNEAYAAVEQSILNNHGLGLPGCGYDGSAKPGGAPISRGFSAVTSGGFAHLAWWPGKKPRPGVRPPPPEVKLPATVTWVGDAADPQTARVGDSIWSRFPGERTLDAFKHRIAQDLARGGVTEIVWPEDATAAA